jgi:glucose-6-phosphate dehydrogenase assembly protein OpcA
MRAEVVRGRGALASILNLVAWASRAAEADTLADVVGSLGHHQPSRTVILSPGRGDGAVDAEVETHLVTGGSPDQPVLVEVLRLVLHGALVDHAQSAVVPLLRTDLPTVLWWPSAPQPADPTFAGLSDVADHVVTESGAWDGDPVAALRRMHHAAAGGGALTDLAWAAITPWRQLVAQVVGAERLAGLRGPGTEAVVAHGGPDPTVEGYLLAGWLVDALGDGLDVEFRPGPGIEDGVGGLELVDPGGWRLEVERQPDRASAEVAITPSDGGTRTRVLPVRRADRPALLAGELEYIRRDRPFERAVAKALEIAAA